MVQISPTVAIAQAPPPSGTIAVSQAGADKNKECDNSLNPNHRSLVQGDKSRDYLLYVPDSVSSDTAAPLIVNFHGFGGCATDFASLVGEFHGLHQVAEEEGFLVVYPQGLERTKGGAEWDPGDSESEDITTNDLVFTEQLVRDISDEYSVDTSRVYATGYSNGGMMAYGLACSRRGLIAAAGIMSGVMLQDDCDQGHPTSIIHFHGTEDDVLPLEGNQDFQAVSSIVDFWLEQNSIPRDSLSSDELKGGDVLREIYEGGSEDTSFALYTIKSEYGRGGGHVWFGEEIEGQTPNEILWDFLSENRRQD